jgi:transaldolase
MWQLRYNASDIPVISRIDEPVDQRIVDELLHKFPDFERAYSENGLTPEEFETFGATRRTLRQFIQACHDLDGQVREIMIPNPDAI